jgi:hypothetical protein
VVSFQAILTKRLAARPLGRWDVVTTLQHFALITYALPKERLSRYIAEDRYEIAQFEINGQLLSLLSAVPFLDKDFHFAHFFPFLHFNFGQTNYRAYVRDNQTGEHAVWFFGTTLGSWLVNVPRLMWRLPWHAGKYRIDCRYSAAASRYSVFRYGIDSDWADAEIDLIDTGQSPALLPGFQSMPEQTTILTHPLDGFFYRLDGRLGHYAIWHNVIGLTTGTARHLQFGLFERLGLLSQSEMQKPHSILICPQVEFQVILPPQEVTPWHG